MQALLLPISIPSCLLRKIKMMYLEHEYLKTHRILNWREIVKSNYLPDIQVISKLKQLQIQVLKQRAKSCFQSGLTTLLNMGSEQSFQMKYM